MDTVATIENCSNSGLRPVRSHPSMTKMPVMATKAHISLKDVSKYHQSSSHRYDKQHFSYNKCISHARHRSQASSLGSSQSSVRRGKSKSPSDYLGDDDYREDEGGHDTITSLAGPKVLQKYKRSLSGSNTKCQANDSNHRLEDLFKDEILADIQESDDDEEDDISQEHEPLGTEERLSRGKEILSLMAALICTFWTSGIVRSISLFINVSEVWGQHGIFAALSVSIIFTSTFSEYLTNKIGLRYSLLLGSILVLIGSLLPFLAPISLPLTTTAWLLLLMLWGCGLGIMTSSSLSRLTSNSVATVNGSVMILSSSAIGYLILPFLTQNLCLLNLGPSETALLLGSCASISVISVLLLFTIGEKSKPVSNVNQHDPEATNQNNETKRNQQKNRSGPAKTTLAKLNAHHLTPDQGIEVSAEIIDSLKDKLKSLESFEHLDQIGSEASSRQSSNPDLSKMSIRSVSQAYMSQLSIAMSSNVSHESLKWTACNNSNCNSPSHTQSPLRKLNRDCTHSHRCSFESGDNRPRSRSKPVSLRDIYMRQLQNKLNSYRSRFQGKGSTRTDSRCASGSSKISRPSSRIDMRSLPDRLFAQRRPRQCCDTSAPENQNVVFCLDDIWFGFGASNEEPNPSKPFKTGRFSVKKSHLDTASGTPKPIVVTVVTVVVFIQALAYPGILLFLPAKADLLHLNPAVILSVSGLGDTLGRLVALLKVLTRPNAQDALNLLLLSSLTSLSMTISIAYCWQPLLLIVITLLFGISTGFWHSILPDLRFVAAANGGRQEQRAFCHKLRLGRAMMTMLGPALSALFWSWSNRLEVVFMFQALAWVAAVAGVSLVKFLGVLVWRKKKMFVQ